MYALLSEQVRLLPGLEAAAPSPMLLLLATTPYRFFPLLQIAHIIVGLASVPSMADLAATVTGLPAALRGAFDGFTPAVWGVVLLKALNGLLIPATFKYADNILYAYAKPSSIVVMTVISCLAAGALPSLSLALGVASVVGSIFLYSSKPAQDKSKKS